MVSQKSVEKQLKKIGFKHHGWGRGEVSELHNILLEDEKIFEVVNGIYEGGFALLVATDVRLLLVDKKPMNYLTVEDLRFDMINEMDYSHRLLGARISIASGDKNLKFLSYNQQRLRKLIGHVQHSMAAAKRKQDTHQEGQVQHLEKINQQLQAYLMAQQQYQIQLEQLRHGQQAGASPLPEPTPAKPSPELADYLFAQSLLAQHQAETGQPQSAPAQATASQPIDLYDEGMKEIFGRQSSIQSTQINQTSQPVSDHNPLELNPINIAFSRLPMALRNRKFGRPSFHDHSANQTTNQSTEAQPAPS